MGIMITYCGYNNPMYNMYKNVGVHYTQQKTGQFFIENRMGVD